MSKRARCSFCGSSENEVSKLFSGIDGALICDRCIESCFDILEPVSYTHLTLPTKLEV